jgi:hypothetical protein
MWGNPPRREPVCDHATGPYANEHSLTLLYLNYLTFKRQKRLFLVPLLLSLSQENERSFVPGLWQDFRFGLRS